MARMTDDQKIAQLELLERQAVGYFTGEIAAEQGQAMDYYLSKPFGNEEEGRSQVVSSDVWDVVEGLTPIVLRPFLASDEVVKFNPLGPDDEDAAQQESEYINWVVTQRNDSFTQLVSWCKTGLLQKNGVVKYWWEKSRRASIERYDGLSDDVFALLIQEDGVEVVEHTESVGGDGLPVHDVVLRVTEEVGSAKYEAIPPEEFLIGRDARDPNPKNSTFCQHRRMVTLGALRDMGYDVPDDIEDGTTNDPMMSEQYIARREDEEQNTGLEHGTDKSAREVLFKETYWLIDADGDGKPELRKLCCVGRTILADEETEEVPFVSWTPYPQPFKFYGRCPADETIEIQKVKSTLWREHLNNIYTINNNRTYANESVTLDDLIDNQIGGVVRVKGNGNVAQAVAAAEISPIGGVIQPMIEYLDSAKENRTGFTRYNQGADSSSLNKTATGIRLITESANLRVEIVARSFGNGLAELMRGVHGLCRRHATKAETIRLRGKWVEVDPRGWKKRADMSISVGLGSSDQQMRLQGIQMLLNEQKQLAQLTQGAVVKPANLYASAAKLAEIIGFKDAQQFFTSPEEQQPQQIPPQVQQVLQQAQEEIQQLQQQLQEAQSGIAAKQIDAESRAQVEALKQQTAMQIEAMRDDRERDMNELKAWLQIRLQQMQPPPQLAAEVSGDMGAEDGQD